MATRKKGNWSAHELERLKILYPKCAEDRIAALLGRSVDSVRRRARQLFERPAQRTEWTADDDLQLRTSYGLLGMSALALVLARSEREIRARVEHLRRERRRGPWTSAETALLKRLYGSRADEDLEVCLSRPVRVIRRVAARLCLSKDKRFAAKIPRPDGRAVSMPRWTADDERRLRQLYPIHDNLEVARAMKRSVASVANKASKLGLKKSAEVLAAMGRKNVSIRYRH